MIKKGRDEKNQNFIQINPLLNDCDPIMIMFASLNEFEKWLEVFIEAKKTDEELRIMYSTA
jgi:hypothetical protein